MKKDKKNSVGIIMLPGLGACNFEILMNNLATLLKSANSSN